MASIENLVGFVRRKGIKNLIEISWHYFDLKLNFFRLFYYLREVRNIKLLVSDGKHDEAINNLFNFEYLSPGQIKSEFASLLSVVKEFSPKNVLEVGTSNGGSLFLFAEFSNPSAFVVSIDLPGGHFGGGYPFWKKYVYSKFTKPGQRMFLVRGDSHSGDVLSEVKMIFGGNKVDFLFIDADHSYEGVKKDFEMYSPLVRDGGIIAFHDIASSPDGTYGTNKFWLEIKDRFKSEEFIADSKQRGFGIGVLFV
ncbi:class I SAM-dependent methyltransferase [Patescibacteria group bacterium]|nr:class I SAM-dependent methyltransferase [Patescibacteria group bacterium]